MPPELQEIVQRMLDANEPEENIAAVIQHYESLKPAAPEPQSSVGGPALVLGKAVEPVARNVVTNIATSPTLPNTLESVGGVIGAVEGAAKGGLPGAGGGAYAGAKVGRLVGHGAKKVAGPIASMMEKLSPYAQTLGTLGGVQSGLGLAQMAEPNRRDIGFFGVGPSVDVPGAKPPLINAMLSELMKRLHLGAE